MAAEDISPVSIRAVKRGKYYRRLYNGTESDQSSSNDQKATKIIWRWLFFGKEMFMKKIISFLLILAMVLAIVGCSSSAEALSNGCFRVK